VPIPTGGPDARCGTCHRVVPVFTARSFLEGGARLCPYGIAMVTPQTFTMASGRMRENPHPKFPAASTTGTHRDRPTSARFEPVPTLRAVTRRFLTCTYPSRSPDPHHLAVLATPRLCQGRLPPSPAPPGSGCPQLQRAAATTRRRRPLTSSRSTSTSRRTLPSSEALGIQRDDRLVEPLDAAGVLGHDLGFELTGPVARHLDADRAELGQHRLG